MTIETSMKFQDLKSQVAHDLSAHLLQFKCEKVGIRMMSDKMGIHEKTLKRIIRCENKPGYQTLYKIYRVLLETRDDSLLFERVPELVKQALEKGNPKPLKKEITYHNDIEEEIMRDRCFSEIYFMAGCGPLTQEYIGFRFGEHGQETMRKMLKMGVLELLKDQTLILGKHQANLSAESIKVLGLHFTQRFLRPEQTDNEGENFMGIYAEGLSVEAYDQWLKIDEEAYQKKVELSRNPKSRGNIRAITFMMSDKMNPALKGHLS